MTLIDSFRALWDHAAWADRKIAAALASSGAPDALREFCHVIGAEEVWLSRIESREARAPVWPSLAQPQLQDLLEETHAGYAALLSSLEDSDLEREISYRNSAGRPFTNTLRDILLHVALHGQYHRGKVNLMLRQAGLTPEPTDYIAFVRGAPAATIAEWRDRL